VLIDKLRDISMRKEIINKIKKLFEARDELKSMCKNWKFTLDGKLFGDIGEAIVCHHFDLKPLKEGTKTHDAVSKNGSVLVKIKTTQKDRVGLGLEVRKFQHLIVVKIEDNGEYRFVYNGPGEMVRKNTNSNSISIKKLMELQKKINEEDQLPQKR